MATDVKKTAALKVPILPHDSPAAPQPPSLKTPLYPHQLRALHRCLLIETDGSLAKDFGAFHDYKSRGGCLADAVGMGKTATSIGLILSSPRTRGEGDTLVVAPGHLIHQWKAEIEKFTDDIEVLVGKREYERRATLPPEGRYTHRVVLVDVDTIMNGDKLWYNWRRVFSDKNGYQKKVDAATMERYKKAALFCVKSPRGPCSYEGYVYTGPLHHPFRPWRRVIFDEIQDLVSEGTESQKNLLQLSRTAKNVWLLSATPFPHGNDSVYANHELLGFCRLRMDVEVDHELSSSHPFEIIKRKLYIRSPKHVADMAVTASQKVTRDTIYVEATELERKFFELEKDDIASRNIFREEYDNLRMMMVHPEASKKLREQINGRDEDTRGGKRGKVVKQKNKTVGRFATVNSFAKRSLDTARERYHELEVADIPQAERDIQLVRSSWYLALKIRELRKSPIQSNPFMRSTETSSTPLCLETEEANAIHQYYCRCPHYGSSNCESDDKVGFQTIGRGENSPLVVYKGHKSTLDVIDYFKNEAKAGRKIPAVMGSSEEHEYLDVFIQRKDRFYKQCVTNKDKLIEEQAALKHRIKALEETVKIGNIKGLSEEEDLKARNGSKAAALIQYLWEVQERGEQTIVFSYWHDTLSLVNKSLKKYDLNSAFCNGWTGNMMSKTIKEFVDGKVSILLLSAQAKASGANLQVATNVVLLDPAGSSAEHGATLEQQAIGRAVRMGQENAVKVVRFCVRDTIEEELFNEIDMASAKLITRNNDNDYTCENAHKSLVLPKTQKTPEDDEVCMVESLSARELLKRKTAEAEIIVIDEDSDDDEDYGKKPKAVLLNKPVNNKAVASSSQVKVKAEPTTENAATAKRGNDEVSSDDETVALPDKRARVDSEPAPSAPLAKKWSCEFCDEGGFESYDLALAHERTCSQNSAVQSATNKANNEVQDAVMENVAPTISDIAELRNSATFADTLDAGKEEARTASKRELEEKYRKACNIHELEWNNHHANWLDMLIQLKKVKDDTGTAWVPGQKCRLGKWCKPQRGLLRNYLTGKKTDSVTKGRIKLLDDIGFSWGHAVDATPRKVPTTDEESKRVVSPPAEIVVQHGNVPPTPSPLKGPDVGKQIQEDTVETQETPDKIQTEEAVGEEGRVVSPPADQMNVCAKTAELDGLKTLLVKCELEAYLDKFQDAGISSADQLQDKLQDLSFMEQLVKNTGLSATEAVRLQIRASRQ